MLMALSVTIMAVEFSTLYKRESSKKVKKTTSSTIVLVLIISRTLAHTS